MTGQPVSILVVGAGRFGACHLETWKRLEAEGEIHLAGAVVRSEQTAATIASSFGIPAWTDLRADILSRADGIDIVTPSRTHYDIVRTCLGFADVLVEKPLAITLAEAAELRRIAEHSGRLLLVNHIYRFDPTVAKLKEIVATRSDMPSLVCGEMINPVEPGCEHHYPSLEFLHYFDIVDFLFERRPECIFSEQNGLRIRASLRYPGGLSAVFDLGWAGERRVRRFRIEYPDLKLHANFLDRRISMLRRDRIDKILLAPDGSNLEASLRAFVRALQGQPPAELGADVGERVVQVACAAMPGPRKPSPRVAVMGGGIFGASCAIELSRHADVTLFERHRDLLTEASYLNQLRFHSGFHYPRSIETMAEIQATRDDFYSVFGDSVLDITSYYCTAKGGEEITAERYLSVCRENRLRFEMELPPRGYIDCSQISLSLKTDEGVFDFPVLKRMVQERLGRNRRIRCLLGAEVTDGRIAAGGTKVLTSVSDGRSVEEGFDYVVNTTYANTNLLAKWLRFPLRPLRFDYCEIAVLEIEMPNISMTVLDGPFCSLVSTGHDNIFLLSHVHESLLGSVITPDFMPPVWAPMPANRLNMIRNCAVYFPVLRQAKIVESRFGVRTVAAGSEDFDGRPTVVMDHGFGCWSVLGGKISTCVSNARQIAASIFGEEYRAFAR